MILRSNLVRAVGLVALALLLAYAMPASAQTQPAVWIAAGVVPGVWARGGPLGGSGGLHARLDATRPGHAVRLADDVRAEVAGVQAAIAGRGAAPQFAQSADFVPLHRADINRSYLRADVGG